MPNTSYLKTAVPKPFTVLGLELRPLSIGHMLLMEWQGLNYTTGKKPLVQDLVSACLICSMRFAEYQDFLKDPKAPKIIKKWGKVLNLGTIEEKFNLFDEYLKDGTDLPEVELPDDIGNGLGRGTPFLQCLRVSLMSNLHVRSEEVWDYPYKLAVWDVCSFREARGDLKLIPEDESPERDARTSALLEFNQQLRERFGLIIPGAAPTPSPEVKGPNES